MRSHNSDVVIVALIIALIFIFIEYSFSGNFFKFLLMAT